ncbi:hypothetical protein [Roseobacter sp.]|uniref:hypothetical protein n=1 Tax=Roseobacter sp. TaxID=1907202 RepID=UPI00260150F0|nr:hypothetical protein [Roseobacter sp.]
MSQIRSASTSHAPCKATIRGALRVAAQSAGVSETSVSSGDGRSDVAIGYVRL